MNKQHLSSSRLLGAALHCFNRLNNKCLAGIKRDYGTYPVPPPPPLPPAGGTVIDPTFETTIMRLTG